MLESFKTAQALIFKSHLWFSSLLYLLLMPYSNEYNRAYRPIQNLQTLSLLLKKGSKKTSTQIANTVLRRSYVIKIFCIGTMSKRLDIQRPSVRMSQPHNQVLCIVSHQGEIINIYQWLQTTIYHYSYFRTILTRKCESRLRSVAHALLLGLEESFTCL